MFTFKATKGTAFLAGFALGFAAVAADIANKRGLIGFTLDSPTMFPYVLIFFFVSVLALVVGPQGFSIESIPFTNIPKDRSGWASMAQTWVRMVVWFLGAVVGVFSLLPFK